VGTIVELDHAIGVNDATVVYAQLSAAAWSANAAFASQFEIVRAALQQLKVGFGRWGSIHRPCFTMETSACHMLPSKHPSQHAGHNHASHLVHIPPRMLASPGQGSPARHRRSSLRASAQAIIHGPIPHHVSQQQLSRRGSEASLDSGLSDRQEPLEDLLGWPHVPSDLQGMCLPLPTLSFRGVRAPAVSPSICQPQFNQRRFWVMGSMALCAWVFISLQGANWLSRCVLNSYAFRCPQ
jgi:hypothetical protein